MAGRFSERSRARVGETPVYRLLRHTTPRSRGPGVWLGGIAALCLLGILPTSTDAGSVSPAGPRAADAKQVVSIGHLDIEGGGMVDVRGNLAAVGHMAPPYATSLLDVSDPARVRILSRIRTKPGTHSHKARLCDDLLITNHEQSWGWKRGDKVGLGFFDVSDPTSPAEIGFLEMGGTETLGTGAHRFQADCRRKLVYVSGSTDGFQGNISMIVDFSDPRRPKEAGRWWLPGQWLTGGEKPSWTGNAYRTHHPNRWGDRLYVSLWMGGFAIVDISNPAAPRTIRLLNYHPPYSSPTHTALPVGHPVLNRHWLLVFDEELGGPCDEPAAFMWVVDITDERHPVPVATFQPPDAGKLARRCDSQGAKRFGAHQPHEVVAEDNLVYAAWFAGGLRVIDIANPYRPEQVGYYVPTPPTGRNFPESNDVFVDATGRIFLIDRVNGLEILRFTGRSKP